MTVNSELLPFFWLMNTELKLAIATEPNKNSTFSIFFLNYLVGFDSEPSVTNLVVGTNLFIALNECIYFPSNHSLQTCRAMQSVDSTWMGDDDYWPSRILTNWFGLVYRSEPGWVRSRWVVVWKSSEWRITPHRHVVIKVSTSWKTRKSIFE